MAELVPNRFVGAYMSMLLGIVPLFLFPLLCFYPISGCAAIIYAFWSWKKPGSLVHGPRHGMAIAGILGGFLQILIFGGTIAMAFINGRNN